MAGHGGDRERVAAHVRRRFERGAVNERTDRGRRRLDDRRATGDRHRFAYIADFEFDVQRQLIARADLQAGISRAP